MKNIAYTKHAIIAMTAVCLQLLSCSVESPQEEDLRLIETIENHLLPSVLIEGKPLEEYNILERMEKYNIPGVSIAFLNRGEIVWAKGYGFTNADSARAVDENTLFQAASISKPVAAMAALSLVEEGKIGLDDDVNQYLVDWQVEENEHSETEKVTLRRILSHSAGLTVHGFGGYAYDDEVPDIFQIINGEKPANSGRIFPNITPGTIYRYSGGGYTVMQKMLTDITGMEFPEIMDERVLSKLGMSSSMYRQPLPEGFHENAASAHKQNGEMIEGRWQTYPEMAAAGLWTTPTDLLKYAIEVQQSFAGESNLVLSKEMVAKMLTPQMNNHGLGPVTGGSGDSITFSHGGSNAGFRCEFLAFTKLGQGIAIMTNGEMGGYLMSEILRSFSDIYQWNIYKPDIKTLWPLEEEDLLRFAGRYQFSIQGRKLDIEVTLLEDHLKAVQSWDDLNYEIFPESAYRFFNTEDGVSFDFEENQDGRLEIVVHQFGQEFRFVKI
jgi:CubicO group peptidase (beta-lactamase class C family)